MTTETTESASAEDKLTAAARAERLARAQSLTKNYVLASAGIGFIPVPLADLGALMALQVKMVHGLANHYGVPFKESLVKSLIGSLISGAGSVVSMLGLYSLAKSLPVLGALGGGGGVAVTAATATYAVGAVFTRHFESGGTLLNFDPHKVKDAFAEELKKGKEAASGLLKRSKKNEGQAAAAPAADATAEAPAAVA